jgi:phosphoribosylanthranilate isomerase
VFRIKICGITNLDDALLAADAGAQAVGLNFYPGTPRCVGFEAAAEIAASLPRDVARVGVFVDAPLAELLAIRERVGLDFVQLHGDEPPEIVAQLHSRGLQVVRAFRCGDEGLAPPRAYLLQCRQLGALPDAVLIDARAPGQYGGTGQTVDWPSLGPLGGRLEGCPLLLAGGLTPDNVSQAIATAKPFGVDTASGVESSPGRKDPARVRRFITFARNALQASEP